MKPVWPPRRQPQALKLALPNPRLPLNKLRALLQDRTELAETSVQVGRKAYRIFHPKAADALIDERDFDLDERLPYWAAIWPSAMALTQHLSEQDLSGKKVIELGCGVGLPSVVALDQGAEVTATDHYTIALDFTRQNAKTNTSRELETVHLDWHSPDKDSLGQFDLILAADLLYEQRNVPALLKLIPDLLGPSGEALVSNPRSRDTPNFHRAMKAEGFSHNTLSMTARQGERDIEVALHRFQRVS